MAGRMSDTAEAVLYCAEKAGQRDGKEYTVIDGKLLEVPEPVPVAATIATGAPVAAEVPVSFWDRIRRAVGLGDVEELEGLNPDALYSIEELEGLLGDLGDVEDLGELGGWGKKLKKLRKKAKRAAKKAVSKGAKAARTTIRNPKKGLKYMEREARRATARVKKSTGTFIKKQTGSTFGASRKAMQHRRQDRMARIAHLDPKIRTCVWNVGHKQRKAEKKAKVEGFSTMFDWRLGRSNARVRHRTKKCVHRAEKEAGRTLTTGERKGIKRQCEKVYKKKYGANPKKAAQTTITIAALAASVVMPFAAGPLLIGLAVASVAAAAGQAAMTVKDLQTGKRDAKHARQRDRKAASAAPPCPKPPPPSSPPTSAERAAWGEYTSCLEAEVSMGSHTLEMDLQGCCYAPAYRASPAVGMLGDLEYEDPPDPFPELGAEPPPISKPVKAAIRRLMGDAASTIKKMGRKPKSRQEYLLLRERGVYRTRALRDYVIANLPPNHPVANDSLDMFARMSDAISVYYRENTPLPAPTIGFWERYLELMKKDLKLLAFAGAAALFGGTTLYIFLALGGGALILGSMRRGKR